MSTSITSEVMSEEQKRQYLRFVEDAALKALKIVNPGKSGIQKLIQRGDEFQSQIVTTVRELSTIYRFADEEVKSLYTYPESYKGAKPIADQIKTLVELFGVRGDMALQYAKSLPQLSEGIEWFAIPKFQFLVPEEKNITLQYCKATEIVLEKIREVFPLYSWRHELLIGPQHLRVSIRTFGAMIQLEKEQPGDVLIIPAQLGLKHRGRSTRRSREVFDENEFGLWTSAVGIIALTHPERFTHFNELDIYCAGDEISISSGDFFVKVPSFCFIGGLLRFGAHDINFKNPGFGSASFFLLK